MSERQALQGPQFTVRIENGREIVIDPDRQAWGVIDNMAYKRFQSSRETRNTFWKRIFKSRRIGFERMDYWDRDVAIGNMVGESLRLEQLLDVGQLLVREDYQVTRTRTTKLRQILGG